MNTRTPADEAGSPPASPPEPSEADKLIAQAAAARTPPVGLNAAIERLRELDEDAHVLWRTSGPRNSHIDELAGVLAEVEGARRVYIVQAFASGKVRFWAECAPDWPPLKPAT